MSSSIITFKILVLKFEKVLASHESPVPSVPGLETMMKPMREDKIKASRILLVANMYIIRKIAGTNEKAPY